MSKVGIIGGGISGLASAYKLLQKHPAPIVHIFEKNSELGGRIFTKKDNYSGSNQKYDIGANLIDFENQEIQKMWRTFSPPQVSNGLIQFKKDFLIHEKGQFRKGDYNKPRYYFQGGFHNILTSYVNSINNLGAKIFIRNQVKKITENDKKQYSIWINSQGVETVQTGYDQIVLSCPTTITEKILDQSLLTNHNVLKKHIQNTNYTKQISVAFETTKQMPEFSGMLFIKHEAATFICSHEQKYGKNGVVIQTTQKFTEQNLNKSDEEISQNLYDLLPEKVKSWVIPKFIYVHKWDPSLIKPNKDYNPKQSVPISDNNIFLVGDSIMGKSRVSNAVASGLMIA